MTAREYLELMLKTSKDDVKVDVAGRMLRDGDYPPDLDGCIDALRDNVVFLKEQRGKDAGTKPG